MPKPQTALATTTAATALAVAAGVNTADRRGKENLNQKDFTFPRLAIAQKTSPQITPGTSEYLDGLKLFQMFNTLTGENKGQGPVTVAVVRVQKRAMQFDPVTLKVVDFDVPWNDPRCQFTNVNGARVKPVATPFYDFLCLDAETGEPFMLSMKGAQMAMAKKLTSLLAYRNGPAWAGLYEVRSDSKTSGSYTSGIFIVKPAGPTPPAIMTIAEEMFVATEGQRIDTDRTVDAAEKTDDDTIPF